MNMEKFKFCNRLVFIYVIMVLMKKDRVVMIGIVFMLIFFMV